MATSSSRENIATYWTERDSLREEIGQSIEENITEHEVITETVFNGDTVKTVRVTERMRSRDAIATGQTKWEAVRVVEVHDTVFVQRTDSVVVEKARGVTPAENRRAPWLEGLKWIFAIIVAIGGLVVIIKILKVFRV